MGSRRTSSLSALLCPASLLLLTEGTYLSSDAGCARFRLDFCCSKKSLRASHLRYEHEARASPSSTFCLCMSGHPSPWGMEVVEGQGWVSTQGGSVEQHGGGEKGGVLLVFAADVVSSGSQRPRIEDESRSVDRVGRLQQLATCAHSSLAAGRTHQ